MRSYFLIGLDGSRLNRFLVDQLLVTCPDLDVNCSPSALGTIRLCLSGQECLLDEAQSLIASAFAEELYSMHEPSFVKVIHNLLIEIGCTLAVAESCTGGRLSEALTRFEGASRYLIGGVIAYSNALKCSLLGVHEQTLARFGAVSRETIQEMALGLLDKTEADYVLASSGFASPAGCTSEAPLGTVWGAVAERRQGVKAERFAITSSCRETIMTVSTGLILHKLWKQLPLSSKRVV